MSYTLTFAGQSLPKAEVDGIDIQEVTIGSTHRTPDATMRQSVVDLKHIVKIQWPWLNSAAYGSVHSAHASYYDAAAQPLVLPSGDTYTGWVREFRHPQMNMGGSTIWYRPSWVFEEA